MKIKKFLFISMLLSISVNAHAQMVDLIGSMGVGGAMDRESVRAVGMANNRLKSTQLINDINMKMMDIILSYDGRYKKMPTQTITSAGRKVVFRSADKGAEAYVENVNEGICATLLTAGWQNVYEFRVHSDRGASIANTAQAAQDVNKLCKGVKNLSIMFR